MKLVMKREESKDYRGGVSSSFVILTSRRVEGAYRLYIRTYDARTNKAGRDSRDFATFGEMLEAMDRWTRKMIDGKFRIQTRTKS